MYTVLEIADQLNISKQTVYVRIHMKEMENHVFKKNGMTLVDDEGLNFIKDGLRMKNSDSSDETETIKTDYIEHLKEQIKEKDSQIVSKDKQINDLNERFKNSQILQLNNTQNEDKILLLTEKFRENKVEKKGFIGRIFSK